jgi:hypothetical protein
VDRRFSFKKRLYCVCYIALRFSVKENKGLSWMSFGISEGDLTASMVCSTKITEFSQFFCTLRLTLRAAFGRKESLFFVIAYPHLTVFVAARVRPQATPAN